MNSVVVIPAHNEEKEILQVLAKTKEFNENIIVVDDGSTDYTASIVAKEGVTLLQHRINLGKGAALKTGCDFAFMNGADVVIVMDADGQHDPGEIPIFLEELKTKEIVFSYRKDAKVMPFVLRFGNRFINKTLSTLYGVSITDSQSGFRAFTKEAYKKIRWDSSDYYMETEMIIKTGRNQLAHSQIPIKTIYSDRYKGTTVLDGVKIVLKMFGGKIIR